MNNPPNISDTDLAWAAGLIDGEGCIHITKRPADKYRRENFQLTVAVCMTHKPTIERLYNIFKVGSVCHKHPRGKQRTPWTWTVLAQQAEAVLRLLMPYLFTKLAEGKIAFEFRRTMLGTRGRRGVPAPLMQERRKLYRKMRAAKLLEWKG